jgi:cellobiose-specific phosphotransferase system component IIB
MEPLDEKRASNLDFDFRNWILKQESDDYLIENPNKDTFILETDYGKATIRFYPDDIVEFSITSNKDGEVKYYLHFQLNDEEHAKQLFEEMAAALVSLKNEKTIKVLLSCTSAFTTSYFAEKLNEAAKTLELNYEFNAVPYLNIYEQANDYDVLMLAPQIGYMHKKLAASLPDKPVLQIPTAVFASYDSMKALEFVRDEVEKFKEEHAKQSIRLPRPACQIESESIILGIAMITNPAQTKIYYRIIDHGEVVANNLTIKDKIRLSDLEDIISIALSRYPKLDMIGIAVPGIVDEHRYIDFPTENLYHFDLLEMLYDKYHIPTVISNSANMGALGFAKAHPEYKNLTFISQPIGFVHGGQGNVVDGKILEGKKGLSGESKFFIKRMQFSDSPNKLCWTEAGMMEIVTKSILPTISILGPEAIAMYSPMTSDMNEVKMTLTSFIPEEYLPEFISVKDPSTYMIDVIIFLTLDIIEKQEQEDYRLRSSKES